MTPSLAELGRALDVAEAIVEITDEGFDEFDAARTAYIDALHAEYVRKLDQLVDNPVKGDAETLINQAHHTWKAASRHVVVLKARWYVLTHGDAAIGNLADHVDRELVSQYLAKQPTCRQRIDMAAAEELAWARYRHISERYDFAKEHDRDQIKRGELLPRGFTKPPRPRVRHAYKFGT